MNLVTVNKYKFKEYNIKKRHITQRKQFSDIVLSISYIINVGKSETSLINLYKNSEIRCTQNLMWNLKFNVEQKTVLHWDSGALAQ